MSAHGALLDAALLVAASTDPAQTLKHTQRALDVLLDGLRQDKAPGKKISRTKPGTS